MIVHLLTELAERRLADAGWFDTSDAKADAQARPEGRDARAAATGPSPVATGAAAGARR